MKRSVLMTAGMAAALIRPAMADDLNISSRTTSAVMSATAANSSPGNITIGSGGTVEVSLAASAVTLNSNNALINNGLISNAGGNGSVGVNVVAGVSGSFLNSGNITVTGTGNTTLNQFGVLLNGTGVFTGDIATGSASTISVTGLTADAIAIQSELNGNLTLRGNVTSTGTSALGVTSLANIAGTFTNAGNITTLPGDTSTTQVNPTAGAAVSLGGSVIGGILNAGPTSSSDTTPAATISVSGSQPAFIVAPSVALNQGPITIGLVPDTVNPGNSFINRGHITAAGTQPGVNTTALQIGNNVGDSALATTLSGPILNIGSIEASATSDNKNATAVAPTAASATAMILSNGTTAPGLVNAAGATISASTGGPVGGGATAFSITSGTVVRNLNNAGLISASANTTNTAITALSAQAIVDSSGFLTNIANSGTISATATKLDNNAQTALALNLAATPLPVTINNTGTIVGDIAFGSSTANVLTIEGPRASVNGQIKTTGIGRVNIAISGAGTGGTLTANGTIQAGNLTVGPGGTLNLDISSNTTAVSATGPAQFDAASHLVMTPLALLPADTNITLVHSDTALVFGNLSATTQGFTVPFLFEGNLTASANNLTLVLHRKSASELGLTGNDAILFGPATTAASADAPLGAAFSTLDSAASVQLALTDLAPIVNGAPKAAADTISNSTTNVLAQRQRMLTYVPEVQGRVSLWVEGVYDRYHDSSSAAYSGNAAGGTAGIDYSLPYKGHFGIAFTYYDADLNEAARIASTTSKWVLVSPYVGFRLGGLFVNAQFNAGGGSLHFARTVDVGSLTRLPTGDETQWIAGGGLTGGYVADFGAIKIVPQINLNGFDLKLNRFQEQNGGTGVDLAIKQRSQTSFRAFAGAAAEGSFQVLGAHLVPELLAGWSQELVTPTNTVDASFAEVPGTDFTISGPNEARSRFVGTGGLAYVATSWSVGLSYDRSFESKANVQSARLMVAGRF